MVIQDTNRPKVIMFPNLDLSPGAVNYVVEPKKYNPFPDKLENIPQGIFLLISQGEYSDYGISGLFKTLKEIDPNLMIRGWLEANPDQKDQYSFDHYAFVSWLVSIDFLEEVTHWTWHTNNYSSSNEMSVDAADKKRFTD